MSRTVLFICTGNYYRSRFAEIMFNTLAPQHGSVWRAISRGLKIGWPGNVGPISPHAEQRLTDLGIDFSSSRHMPVLCQECDLASADLVIALKEAEHRAMLAERFAGWEQRVTYWHIDDLDGLPPDDALSEIERMVRNLIGKLR